MEEKLNDYQKSVLSNGETLRAKLLIYLQKEKAVECYAKTAENAFYKAIEKTLQKQVIGLGGAFSTLGFFCYIEKAKILLFGLLFVYVLGYLQCF